MSDIDIGQMLTPPHGAQVYAFLGVVGYLMFCVIRAFWEPK